MTLTSKSIVLVLWAAAAGSVCRADSLVIGTNFTPLNASVFEGETIDYTVIVTVAGGSFKITDTTSDPVFTRVSGDETDRPVGISSTDFSIACLDHVASAGNPCTFHFSVGTTPADDFLELATDKLGPGVWTFPFAIKGIDLSTAASQTVTQTLRITVADSPEPATFVLLLGPLVLAGGMRFRRTKTIAHR
jgi:hypothetical protein